MTRPLGFYTSVMPSDGSLLDEMQACWGSTFEALNNCQRCWMIHRLSDELQAEFYEDHDRDSEVEEMMLRIDELPTAQKIGLIEALINQVKTR